MADPKRRIALISTGGTIEKTYDPLSGVLSNEVSVLDVMLTKIQTKGVELVRVPLMNKDSRDMTDGDHTLIANTAGAMAEVPGTTLGAVIVSFEVQTLGPVGEGGRQLAPPGRNALGER